MPYIGTQPKDVRSFGKVQFDFTATQGQTAFTGADDDGKTLGFTEGQIQVYVNGILMDASDYTTSNTNTVTLASAANLNDIITVVALQTDIPNSDYVPISGGTFTGNVGVGAAPSSSMGLDVRLDGGGSSRSIRIHNTGTTASDSAVLRISTNNNTSNSYIFFGDPEDSNAGEIRYSHASDFMSFDTSGSERMRIDSAGRVTMPYQPAFCLQGTGIQSFSGAASGWVFKRASGGVHINRGNHLVPSTGVFTAPVAGAYKFTWQMAQSESATGPGASLDVNGGSVGEIAIGYYVAYGSFGGSIIRELSANDTVRITVTNYNSTTFNLRLSRCYFSGFLIG